MYYYIVKYYDKIDERVITDSGLIGAESWGAAVESIVKFYGGEEVISVKVEEIDNPISEEEILYMFNHEVDDD